LLKDPGTLASTRMAANKSHDLNGTPLAIINAG